MNRHPTPNLITKETMDLLYQRWSIDPIFIKMLRLTLREEAFGNPAAHTKWFSDFAPKVLLYATQEEELDYRCLQMQARTVGNLSFSYKVLDYGKFSDSTFDKTGFQSASVRESNFSGSRFLRAQMSPIYAYQANFSNCEFERCFLMGTSPRNHTDPWGVPVKAPFSDLRNCNFTGVKAHKTAFERCDFKGADLSHAHFTECTFTSSDLIEVVLQNTRFERCNFDRAWLDDTPQFRALVERGENTSLETIVWVDINKR